LDFLSVNAAITKKDLAGKPVQDGPASTIPTKFNYILVMACPSPPNPCQFTGLLSKVSASQ